MHAAVLQQFGTGRGGLPGNDDSGGLSSWYVWASLGLFPVAGQNLFLVNAPSFRSARIQLAAGPLRIETEGFVEPRAGGPVQYVQSATLNGAPLARSWISGAEFHAGGELRLRLGPEPSDWGRSERPPSSSTSESPDPRSPGDENVRIPPPDHRQPRRPVICGHSVEGRNLAEAALTRGFDEVRIVTWPLERLATSGLPLKPLETVLPYSAGIHVERPEPVGDYKVPTGATSPGSPGVSSSSSPTVCRRPFFRST
nr:glycoside hydrolase domain-containing protein [Microbacterium sp. NIBRBAC000506063]